MVLVLPKVVENDTTDKANKTPPRCDRTESALSSHDP